MPLRLTQAEIRRIDAQKTRELRPLPSDLNWDELLRPERMALAQLLLLLSSGLEDERGRKTGTGGDPAGPRKATSFLLSGRRGSGKTTVILSAQRATVIPQTFFPTEDDLGEEELVVELLGEAVKKRLHDGLFWLPVLDMDLLSPGANLLTAVLICIRNALGHEPARQDTASEWRGPGLTPALLREEGLDEAWTKVDALLRSATLAWREVPENSDPWREVDRQIKVAETTNKLRADFADVVKSVAEHLKGGSRTTPPVIVLPIDNADRCTEHASQVLKLIRSMVSPYLWYVLSADESDLSVFLERSQREALEIQKAGAGSDSETLDSIARRQAAAALWTALPPAHRIQLRPVEIGEALAFNSLADNLGKIPVEWMQGEALEGTSKPEHLLDLLASGYHDGTGDWTIAGELALSLPIRHLVDLWQSASYFRKMAEPKAQESVDNARLEHAIELVYYMFESTVKEGDLPAWASRYLLKDLIWRNTEDRICLNYTKRQHEYQWRLVPRVALDVGASAEGPTGMVVSKVTAYECEACACRITRDGAPRQHGSTEAIEVWLPSHVFGWLMLLQDLLMQRRETRITHGDNDDVPIIPLVETRHLALIHKDRVVELKMPWSHPSFGTFFDSTRLSKRWTKCLNGVYPETNRKSPTASPTRAAGADELKALMGHYLGVVGVISELQKCDEPQWLDLPTTAAGTQPAIETVDGQLSAALGDLKKTYEGVARFRGNGGTQRFRVVEDWLRESLPLLLEPEFCPGLKDGILGPKAATVGGKKAPSIEWMDDVWQKDRLGCQRYQAVALAIRRGFEAQGIPVERSMLMDACWRWFDLHSAASCRFPPSSNMNDVEPYRSRTPPPYRR